MHGKGLLSLGLGHLLAFVCSRLSFVHLVQAPSQLEAARLFDQFHLLVLIRTKRGPL